MAPLAEKVVEELGFPCIVVTFDNPNHGERMLQEELNNSWRKGNKTHATDMYSQLLNLSFTITTLIDFLPCKLGVKASKHAVVGKSLGGHAVLICMTSEPRVDVGVSFISSADYLMNMEIRYNNLIEYLVKKQRTGEIVPFDQLVPEGLKNAVLRYDPVRNIEKFCRGLRPALIINGEEDSLVPKACNSEFVTKAKQNYEEGGKSDCFEHIVMENVKHEVTREMEDFGVSWLRKHLVQDNSSSL